jgi:hypothetical protein
VESQFLNPHFHDILAALSDEQAEFLVVGAYALAAHGLVRSTGDLDIWVRPTPENAERVWRALVRFHAPLSSAKVDHFTDPEMVYRMGLPPNGIDILMSISGVDFDDAWSNRLAKDIEGVNVYVIAPRDQIRNKRATGRAKDLIDADWLEKHRPTGS